MSERDQYVLGYRRAEQQRLQQQAQQLADESSSLFDEIGVRTGTRVVEIGCGPHGCLEILAERVGSSGSVVGVERSQDAVDLARKLISERGLTNVEVFCRDARSTGLPRASFDLATATPRTRQCSRTARDRCGGRCTGHTRWKCRFS